MYVILIILLILYIIGRASNDKTLSSETSKPIITSSGAQLQEENFMEETMSIIKKGIDAVTAPVKKLLSRANRNRGKYNYWT